MSAITEQQVQNYIGWGGVPNLRENKDFVKATKLKESLTRPHWKNDGEVEKVKAEYQQLFLKVGQSYLQQAQNTQDPCKKSLFSLAARESIRDCSGYRDSEITLAESAEAEEVKGCLAWAETSSEASQKASLLFHAAIILTPRLRELPKDFGCPNANSAKQLLAGETWEKLGDLFLKHKKNIDSPHNFKYFCPVSERPKYAAAYCFFNAATAVYHGNCMEQRKKQDYRWNDLSSRSVALLDRAVKTLESSGPKLDDPYYSAQLYETLADLYQSKWHSCYLWKKEGANWTELDAKVSRYRIESAKVYGELIEKHPDSPQYYYKKAVNLAGAAAYVKTVGEAAPLLAEAIPYAVIYREKNHVPAFYTISWDNDETHRAFGILIRNAQIQKRLAEKGPNDPLYVDYPLNIK